MDFVRAEVHQIGDRFVHLFNEGAPNLDECYGLIEGGGICLASSFRLSTQVDRWLDTIFHELYPGHRCDLGCIRLPEAEFLAAKDVLKRLAGPDPS